MKTNTIAQHPVSFHTPQAVATVSWFSNPGRFLLAALCAALVSFAAVPAALAAGPNGTYKFVSATGSITAMGETQELPQDLVQQLVGTQSGGIVVKSNKITLDRKVVVKLVKKLAKEFGATVKYKLTGPTSLKFSKHGKVYTGSTSKPMKVTFDVTIPGADQAIKGTLATDVDATVKGKNLTLRIPISGKVLGEKITADLKIICQR